jgi:hypothetical protein
MTIKWTKIFLSKVFQNASEWGFLVIKNIPSGNTALKVEKNLRSDFASSPAIGGEEDGKVAENKLSRKDRGCQIFLGPNITKREKVPNNHNLYQTAVTYTK